MCGKIREEGDGVMGAEGGDGLGRKEPGEKRFDK